MFDKEIVKQELEPIVQGLNIDLDKVVDEYEIIDGFYVFRILEDAEVFQESNFIESWVGFYASGDGDGGQ